MKKQAIAAFFLLLVILSDGFLKNYVRNSLLFGSIFGYLSPLALLVLAASLCYLFYFLRKQEGEGSLWDEITKPLVPGRWEHVLVFAIIALGIVLRFWRLSSLFAGAWSDEGANGVDAIAIRYFGERPIFLNWYAGREALHAYLIAAFTVPFGYSVFAVRVVEAVAGCATLAFFYFFVKQFFQVRIALWALFLMSVSKYHIILSRFGIPYSLMVLMETMTLYLLWRGLTSSTNKRYLWLILAGLSAGLGFYTYIPYRVFPLVLLGLLFAPQVRGLLRKNAKALIAACVVCVLTVAPLVYFFVTHQESFTDRMNRTAAWAGQKDPLPVLLLRSTGKTLGMFTYEGDPSPRHEVAEEPALSPYTTAAFLLGCVFLLSNLRKPFAPFLLIYFAIGVLPGVLGQAPHGPRTLPALPPAMIISAFGVLSAAQIFLQTIPVIRGLFLLCIIAGNLWSGPNDALFRYSANLDAQPPDVSSLSGMDSAEADVADLVGQLGNGCDVYLTPQLFFHSTVDFMTFTQPEHHLYTADTVPGQGKISIVILQTSRRNLWWLRDDEGKNFFKWWHQRYGMEIDWIRSTLRRSYGTYGKMTRQSDLPLLRGLMTKYPSGKLLYLRQFSVYIIKR